MFKTIAVAAIVGAALLLPAAAGAKDSGGKAVFTPDADLKWSDVPDRAGVQIAPVSGDPSKGASRFFVKLPAGISVPLHHHSPDHHGVVITGTMVLNVDGQDHTLPPGSYFSFTGKKKHTTHCNEGTACTVFIDTKGKWDVVEEKAPKK